MFVSNITFGKPVTPQHCCMCDPWACGPDTQPNECSSCRTVDEINRMRALQRVHNGD